MCLYIWYMIWYIRPSCATTTYPVPHPLRGSEQVRQCHGRPTSATKPFERAISWIRTRDPPRLDAAWLGDKWATAKVFIYMYIYSHTWIYMYIYTYLHICVHICTPTDLYIYPSVCIDTDSETSVPAQRWLLPLPLHLLNAWSPGFEFVIPCTSTAKVAQPAPPHSPPYHSSLRVFILVIRPLLARNDFRSAINWHEWCH